MLWGLTDEDIDHFKKNVAAAHVIHLFLLKPNLTEEQIARFAVNQYKYPSLDVRPYFQTKLPIWRSLDDTYFGYVGRINDRDVERPKKKRIC